MYRSNGSNSSPNQSPIHGPSSEKLLPPPADIHGDLGGDLYGDLEGDSVNTSARVSADSIEASSPWHSARDPPHPLPSHLSTNTPSTNRNLHENAGRTPFRQPPTPLPSDTSGYSDPPPPPMYTEPTHCNLCPSVKVSLTRHFRLASRLLVMLGVINIVMCTCYAYIDANQGAYGSGDWQKCIVYGEVSV